MVPEVASMPLQPPEALQLSALVALHCSVTGAPTATLVSLAFRLTDGGATDFSAPLEVCGDVTADELAPHAASAPRRVRASSDFNAHAYRERQLRRIELINISQILDCKRIYFVAMNPFIALCAHILIRYCKFANLSPFTNEASLRPIAISTSENLCRLRRVLETPSCGHNTAGGEAEGRGKAY
jgi:hypothetical protein